MTPKEKEIFEAAKKAPKRFRGQHMSLMQNYHNHLVDVAHLD
jgi:hypothetical protein